MASWKIPIFDKRYMFKCLVFHCHVSFPGVNSKLNLNMEFCYSCYNTHFRKKCVAFGISDSPNERVAAQATSYFLTFFFAKQKGILDYQKRYFLEEHNHGPWRFGSDYFPFFSWVMAVGEPAVNLPGLFFWSLAWQPTRRKTLMIGLLIRRPFGKKQQKRWDFGMRCLRSLKDGQVS